MKETKKTSIDELLNRISLLQIAIISSLGFIYIYLDENISSAFIISGLTTALYTQLIRLSSTNKVLILLGFPIRIMLCGLPCAILVHKLQSNLIALFIGFLISQIIFFYFAIKFAKEQE